MPCASNDFKLSGKRATRVSPGANSLTMPKSNLPPQWLFRSGCKDEYHLRHTCVHRHPRRLFRNGQGGPCDVGHREGCVLTASAHCGAEHASRNFRKLSRFEVASAGFLPRACIGIAGSGLNLYDDLEFKEPYTMRPNVNLMKATLTGALGGLLFGFDTVVISGAIDALTRLYHLSDYTKGWTVAIALVGTVVGSFGAGIVGQKLGGRETLRLTAVL